MKKKLTAIIVSLVLVTLLFAGCSKKDSSSSSTSKGSSSQSSSKTEDSKPDLGKTLNLYAWDGMFPPEVISAFETKTGVKVNYTNYDSGETMLSKLQVSSSEYDLIFADDYILDTVVQEGLAKKLEKDQISNIKNINHLYQKQFFDKDDEYVMPYGAGIMTIVYNPEMVDFEITKFEDLWDARLRDNVGIIDNPRVVTGFVLKMFGESFNTDDLTKITTAGEKLYELAPNIRLIKGDYLNNDLIGGEFAAGLLYTSQATLAKIENEKLKVVFPEEGLGFGLMGGFIPSGTANSPAAHAFLDFISEPENAAKCFEYLGYYSTNKAADEFISDEFKEFLTLPADLDTSKMETIQNISKEATDLHNQIWTEFKSRTA